jgi:hypothetical protein
MVLPRSSASQHPASQTKEDDFVKIIKQLSPVLTFFSKIAIRITMYGEQYIQSIGFPQSEEIPFPAN